MILTLGPELDRTNTRLVALWELFQQRLTEKPDFKAYLETNTKAAGVIMEAFCPHYLHDPNFCKNRLLEATVLNRDGVGLKKFIRNDIDPGEFGKWYLRVYNIVESACLAHQCNHEGADTCTQTHFPADPNLQKRAVGGFVGLIDNMNSGGNTTPMSLNELEAYVVEQKRD